MREDEQERRALVAALLEAARGVNAGEDVEATFRALGDSVRGWKLRRKPDAAPPGSVAPGSALVPVPTAATVADARKAAEQAAERETVRRVFRHWQSALDHPNAKATPERIAKIRSRLRDGYTEADMVAAIDGCAGSKFHRGENESGTKYDDLTLILRNGSTLEKFRDKAPDGSAESYAESIRERSPEEVERERQIASLEREAKAALKAKNVERYNDLVRSIRELRSNG